MSQFLRLLSENDKAQALLEVSQHLRMGVADIRAFEVQPDVFDAVPGKPFAYWVNEAVRACFGRLEPFENAGRKVLGGLKTLSDERFLRCWWEADVIGGWLPIAKGGAYSPFYSDLPLVVNWKSQGEDISWYGYQKRPREGFGASSRGVNLYGHPGITWGRRTQVFGPRLLPAGCIFSDKGPAAFCDEEISNEIEAVCALMLSAPFLILIETRLNAADATARSFEVGVIQETPIPKLIPTTQAILVELVRRAWSLKRRLDTIEETSHAFLLPAALRQAQGELLGVFDPPAIEAELNRIQADIDAIAFELYGFSQADRQAALTPTPLPLGEGLDHENRGDAEAPDEEDRAAHIDQTAGLLSWAVGVAFGRFDWRLATGERAAPAEPKPFDPLPAKSPGMLPDGAVPFHEHASILIDDPGHPHDLGRLIEDVLDAVTRDQGEVIGKDPLATSHWPLTTDIRRWLQREFFAFHLQRYSKSRRKAPIYWPLSTASGSYTLWVYYPALNTQTLFSAVNDFLDGPNGKLAQVSRECAELRMKASGRSRDEENRYATLQAFEQELTDLRDTLLKIAPTYQPNHDDGVQITAAPLWQLFRHKPWQKVLKDTWTKLEKGDYDWAHLAMAYWPERVREKCKTDKSLAIAHGLEDLYVEPEAAPKKSRGKKRKET